MRAAIKKQNKRITKRRFIILLSIFIISISIVVFYLFLHFRDNKTNSDIRNELNNIYEDTGNGEETPKEITRIDKLNELRVENPEIVALIEIEGTNINYPVMQTNNNDYYMTHNYKKEYSKDGSLFLDKAYDWNIPSTNLLIYGHNNVGSREMFVELLKYKKEDFYKSHKTIKFTTTTEEAEYEIIAVFKSRVYYQHEQNVTEFNSFVSNAKKASLYKIEASASYGDQLMTLSTCEYSVKDGRFAVVARKIVKD